MAEGRRPLILSSSSTLSAEHVARRTFATVRRGYDPADVTSFLEWVASEIEASSEREAELRRRLEEAERRASNPDFDEETLTAALGAETARVLRSAHDAAAEVATRAEEAASRILQEAHEDAASTQARAASLLHERSEQAEEAAAGVVRGARDEASRLVSDARQEADAIVEASRAECREMVREAQELRSRILGDLARRRRVLLTQVEQLRAGRGSLTEAVEQVRHTVEQVQDGLLHAEDNARAAAEAAARKAAADQEADAGELAVPPEEEGGEDEAAPVGRGAVEQDQGPGSPADTGPATATSETSQAGEPSPAAPEESPGPAGPAEAPEGRRSEEPEPKAPSSRTMAAHPAGGSRSAEPEVDPAHLRGVPRSPAEVRGAPAASPPPGAVEDAGLAVFEAAEAPTAVPPPPPRPGPEVTEAEGGSDEDKRPSSFRIIRRSRRGSQPEEGSGEAEPHAGAHAAGSPQGRQSGAEAGPGPGGQGLGGQGLGGQGAPADDVDKRAQEIFARIRASREAQNAATEAVSASPDPASLPGGAQADASESSAPAAAEAPTEGEVPSAPGPSGPTATASVAGSGVSGGVETKEKAPEGDKRQAPGDGRKAEREQREAKQQKLAEATGTVERAARTDEDGVLLQKRDRAIEPIVTSLSRRLKRALQDEQNEVLDRLRSGRDRSSQAIVPAGADQERHLREAGAELLEQAVLAGAAFAGGATRVRSRTRETISEEQAAELAAVIGGALRRRLQEGLEELAAGEEPALVEHIGSAYREWKGQRVERLAGDHVAAAFSRGSAAGTAASVPMRWIVDDEGAHCPDCDDNALAGPIARGERYPTGQAYPPVHTGCRCLLVPSPA